MRTNWFLGAFTRNSVPGPNPRNTPHFAAGLPTPCFTRRAPGPQVSPPKFSHNCITFARMVLDHRKQTDGCSYSLQNSFAVKSTQSAKAYINRKDNEGFEWPCSYICYMHICWFIICSLMQACRRWLIMFLNSGTQVLIYHLFYQSSIICFASEIFPHLYHIFLHGVRSSQTNEWTHLLTAKQFCIQSNASLERVGLNQAEGQWGFWMHVLSCADLLCLWIQVLRCSYIIFFYQSSIIWNRSCLPTMRACVRLQGTALGWLE